MKTLNFCKTLAVAALIGTSVIAVTASAHPEGGGYGPGSGMGPGMMGGYGPGQHMAPGMMGGYGPGYGMGPGMMGGYGPGYGMGPGMMGGYGPGYGMGPGMMGGYSPGMMGGMMGPGYGVLGQLNLTPEQWDKVNAIYQQLAKKQWELTGKIREDAFKLRELMMSEKRDRTAINNQYKKLQDVRQQRFQAQIDAQDKVDGVLTGEQKEQLRRFRGWQ